MVSLLIQSSAGALPLATRSLKPEDKGICRASPLGPGVLEYQTGRQAEVGSALSLPLTWRMAFSEVISSLCPSVSPLAMHRGQIKMNEN